MSELALHSFWTAAIRERTLPGERGWPLPGAELFCSPLGNAALLWQAAVEFPGGLAETFSELHCRPSETLPILTSFCPSLLSQEFQCGFQRTKLSPSLMIGAVCGEIQDLVS